MKKEKKILLFIFIILISISIFLFSFGSDFFWHLKVGEYISIHKKIPLTDIFSWYGTKNHLAWISHEWLFEVLIYQFFRIGKELGIFLYVLFMLVLISIILWKQNEKIFTEHPLKAILWATLGMLVFANKTLPRPHLISYFLFALTIYFAYDTFQNEKSKKIYWAPLISLLWSNFHGGSSNLSYIVYGIFLVFSILPITKDKKERAKEKQRKYFYAFFTSIFCIGINPHGIKMLFYPYLNMTYQGMIQCIEEWQHLSLTRIDGIFYFLFMLGILITILRSKKKYQVIDITLLFLFMMLGVKSTRFMPYFFIVATSIIPRYWKEEKRKVQLLPIFIFLLLTIPSFYLTIYQKPEFNLVSEEMIFYLKNENHTLYNSYELGGYLIYKEIPVFIDGRADLYIDTILCDVCEIEQGKNQQLLDHYPLDTFLVKNHTKIESYLRKNPKYQLKLKDQKNSLYILK